MPPLWAEKCEWPLKNLAGAINQAPVTPKGRKCLYSGLFFLHMRAV